ncbi:reverse transcriptase, putative [Babesia caballi]|uniref:Reverse transcriptase, putative n=1 Tax=Babesia caballi TaxID=5871 RepID=A0AAV4M0X5_BABCB|nr:reverse transcriptase, putative [Babesia caballi]
MDPLSRRLRQLYPSVQIRTSDSREFGTNHQLYIDDLKLLAKDEDVMQKMTKETEEYLTHIGLIINRDKSATNSSRCADISRLHLPHPHIIVADKRKNRITIVEIGVTS